MKIIIVDDEPHARDIVSTYLHSLNLDLEICGSYNNVTDAKNAIEKTNPDILFLDIQMNDETGFDLLKQFVKPYSFKVIFTTAYDQYAIKAIKAKAHDYLLKPLDREEFDSVVKATFKSILREDRLKMDETIYNKIIEIQGVQGKEFISFSEVLYCKGESNYTSIITKDKSYLVSKTMKYVFKNILSFDQLVRCHKSYAFNSLHFSSMTANEVTLNDGQKVPVSRSYAESVASYMAQ